MRWPPSSSVTASVVSVTLSLMLGSQRVFSQVSFVKLGSAPLTLASVKPVMSSYSMRKSTSTVSLCTP